MPRLPIFVSALSRPLLLGPVLLGCALLAGCATTPLGPTARVMPAPGKPFAVFQEDQALCKHFAEEEVGGGPLTADAKRLGSALLTTALGAGLGAALVPRHSATGASRLGAVGAVLGAATAGRGSAHDQGDLQGRYDLAYTQCMYSRGNQVPAARVALAPLPSPGR